MGDDGRIVFRLGLKAASVPLEIRRLPFRIERVDAAASCRLVGSDGAHHFLNLRWRNTGSGGTVFGPYDLPADAAAEASFLAQGESFFLASNQAVGLDFVLDVGSSVLAGELGGCGYRVVSLPFEPGDVRVAGTEEPIPAESVDANDQIGGNVFTVVPVGSAKGSSTVQVFDHPEGRIVVGGVDAWTVVAQYRHLTDIEPVRIDRMRVAQVSSDGDCADAFQIGIMADGILRGSTMFPAGTTCAGDVDLSSTPIVTPKGGTSVFQVVAKFAAPNSGASVDGAWNGVPRSGHRNRFGLAYGYVGDEWGSAYGAALNVRAVGLESMLPLHSPDPVASGNDAVLRSAYPGFSKLPLPSPILSNGTVPVLKFRLDAYVGPIAWKQMPFRFTKTEGYSIGSLSLSLYGQPIKGGLSIAGASGNQWNENGQGVPAGIKDGFIVLSWGADGEGVVSPGAPMEIELSGTFSGVGPGDIFSIEPAVQGGLLFDVVTGYLVTDVAFPPFAASPLLFGIDVGPWGSPSGKMSAWGWGLLWSDRSELPHGSGSGLVGSRDWTDARYVPGIEFSQVLANLSVGNRPPWGRIFFISFLLVIPDTHTRRFEDQEGERAMFLSESTEAATSEPLPAAADSVPVFSGLVIVRHAKPSDGDALDEVARGRAFTVGESLKSLLGADADVQIFSSPLPRAFQTACEIARALGVGCTPRKNRVLGLGQGSRALSLLGDSTSRLVVFVTHMDTADDCAEAFAKLYGIPSPGFLLDYAEAHYFELGPRACSRLS